MSGNSFLLDTNIVIAFLNGDPSVVASVSLIVRPTLPYVVVGELYYGAFKSKKAQQNIQRIRSFLPLCQVWAADEETGYWYGHIRDTLRQKGRPIPENDIWIAAIARQHQLTLVSRDKHFKEVEILNLEEW